MDISRSRGFVFFLLLLTGAAVTAAGAQERRAVLVRGNVWVRGIPGFGNNVFPALFGEYRLEFPGPGDSGAAPAAPAAPQTGGEAEKRDQVFSIWLSGEPLHFAEGSWRPRGGLPGIAPMESRDGEALLFGFSFSGGVNLGTWTAVFQFPRGLEAAGLDESSANALAGRWTDRFLYFLSFIKNPADVSLPAVFAF
jgi:hypothetical protein